MNPNSIPPAGQSIPRIAVCLLIGMIVAGTGWLLVDRTEERVAREIRLQESATIRLGRVLLNREMQLAASGLSELASLPLLSEYFEMSKTAPDSVDARELKAYLHDVFAATLDELDAAALLAVSPEGAIVLAIPDPDDDTAAPFDAAVPFMPGAGAFLESAADGSSRLQWRQPVPATGNADETAGALIVQFQPERTAQFESAGLVLRPASARTEAKPGAAPIELAAAQSRGDAIDLLLLRIFALAAGFSVFAALAWPRRSGAARTDA